MIKRGQSPPFDVRQFRAIPHDINNVMIAEESKRELEGQIRYFDSDETFSVTNPIAMAVDIDLLRRSENATERNYASLLTSIENVQDEIKMLYSGLDNALSELHYRVEEQSSIDRGISELYVSDDMHVRAIRVIVSAFNAIVAEARKFNS